MPKTIMTIDDSPTIRQMVKFTLKTVGYEIVEAVDGPSALAKLSVQKIDLFLSDINMPGMNGLELIRKIRAMPTFKFTPIILLTTESDQAKKQEGKAAGATGWVVKPFTQEQLIAVIKRVCPL